MLLDLFYSSSPTELVLTLFTRLFVCFMILPLHEYAHAWAAHKLGDDTAQAQGRMTINPLAHIDPVGMLCMLLVGFGWAKPVPVNPYRINRKVSLRAGSALISAAGPLSNLIAALVMMIFFQVFTCLDWTQTQRLEHLANGEINTAYVIVYIIQLFILINIRLAAFNLLPIPPLDGSGIVTFFAGNRYINFVNKNQQIISVIFMITLVSGILSRPLNFISGWLYDLFVFITSWIPRLMEMI